MIHIYFFNSRSRASVYGIGTYLNQVKNCILRMPGYSFNIVSLWADVSEFVCEVKEGYTLYEIPKLSTNSEEKQRCYIRNVWFLLRPHLLIEEKDQLIFHLNYIGYYDWIVWAKNDFPKCKFVLTIHYQEWCFLLNGNVSQFRKILQNQEISTNNQISEVLHQVEIEQQLYNEVDHVVCLSYFTKTILRNYYNVSDRKISVIYNGLKDENVYINSVEKKVLKQKMFFKENEKIILFVGRLDSIKGINHLIEAFKHVLTAIPSCRLVLVGDGDFSKYLNISSYYWSKITFTGRLDKELLYQLYQIADIGVMPSLHEQCSYVAIEMLMFNIPLLISTTTGLKETLEGFEKIEIIENDDNVLVSIDQIAELIITLLRASNTNKYREIYLNKYEESIFFVNMEKLYKSLTE